jgi:hypothetical protein
MPQPSTAAEQIRIKHPKVWLAFAELGRQCHDAGPLDEKKANVDAAFPARPPVQRTGGQSNELHNLLKSLVGATGFEPVTPCAQGGFQRLLESIEMWSPQLVSVEPLGARLLRLGES